MHGIANIQVRKLIIKLKRNRLFVGTGLLCIITVIFFTQTHVYISGNDNLLPDYLEKGLLQLSKSDRGAEVTYKKNQELWRLANTQATQTSWIDLDINSPQRHDALYLSADLKATIEPENSSNRRTVANLMLLSAGNQQNWDYRVPHLLTAITSTQDWSHYEAGFKLDPNTVQYKISANLSGLTGSLLIKNIALYTAEKSVFYTAGYFSLLLSWVFLLLYLIGCLSKHITRLYQYWPLLAVLLVIIAGILLPADIKYSLLDRVHAFVSILLVDLTVPGTDRTLHDIVRPLLSIDKTGHLIAFGATGFILAWKDKVGYKQYLPTLILFAIATETLQYFIPGRNPMLMDVAIDITGIIAGTSLAYLLKRVV